MVTAAFGSNLVPLDGGAGTRAVEVEGSAAVPEDRRFASFIGVTPPL